MNAWQSSTMIWIALGLLALLVAAFFFGASATLGATITGLGMIFLIFGATVLWINFGWDAANTAPVPATAAILFVWFLLSASRSTTLNGARRKTSSSASQVSTTRRDQGFWSVDRSQHN